MIDWWGVTFKALRIRGASTVLAVFSYHCWLACDMGRRLSSDTDGAGVATTLSPRSDAGVRWLGGRTDAADHDRTDTELGEGGAATHVQFTPPQRGAVDDAGNLYVLETDSHCIQKVPAPTGVITTQPGVRDQPSEALTV